MANERVNKVVLGNETLIDITDSTVTANNMLLGTKAYGADGKPITGVLEVGSTVIVTTPETTLYGENVTLTDGVTTLTETFSNQGVATFDSVIMTGNLTVSATDGTSSGSVTFPVATFKTYNISLVLIPDGKTITPTDDVATWLKCAQIDNRNYTTLSQVLNDPYTLEKLLSNSNACDYMARSTTFAKNEGLVPVMTGDTTPSGEVIHTTQQSGYQAYRVFDGDNTTDGCVQNAVGSYIGYIFTEVKVVKTFIWTRVGSWGATYKLQASNDDFVSDIHDLYELVVDPTTSSDSTIHTESFENNTAYTGYRLIVTEKTQSTSSYVGFSMLQFYPQDASIVDDADTMAMIGKYDYCCEALLGNATWCSAICNSDYADYILDVKVPIMTSDTTPSGTASASSYLSSTSNKYYPYKAFNGDWSSSSISWLPTSQSNAWIQYDFGYPMILKKLTLMGCGASNDYYSSETFKVQGYDGTAFEDILSSVAYTSWGTTFTFLASDNTDAYNIIRLTKTAWSPSANQKGRGLKVQLYGRHATQTDIIHSAPNDGLYYLDDEGTEVPLTTTDPNGIGIVDFSDLPEGDLTIYSSVAKDPDNLSNDYGRTFKITRNTVELWLMPVEGVLYWNGILGNVGEDMSSANGWTFSNYTMQAPTHNTYKITASAPDKIVQGIGGKRLTDANSLHGIVQGISTGTDWYGAIRTVPAKSIANSVLSVDIMDTTLKRLQVGAFTNNYPIMFVSGGSGGTRSFDGYAFWYVPKRACTLYSAVNDTVYYIKDGQQVTFAKTDATGSASLDYGTIPHGTYTLYSTIAKDPSDLSQPYSKTITIDDDTTEIYLMPDNTLYWYGYRADNLEELSTANGWTNYYRRSFYSPTWETNRIDLTFSSSWQQYGVGNKNPLSTHSKICIMNTPTAGTLQFSHGDSKSCSQNIASDLSSGYVEITSAYPYFCVYGYDPKSWNTGYIDFIFVKE